MTLYHGSNLEIDQIDLTKCRPYKDFGQGMAKRVARIYGGEPVITSFEADVDVMNKSGLSVRVFDKPDISWATFVMNNRSHTYSEKSSNECNLENQYDLVIGPVANDDMALLFRQFEEGYISIEILTREMTFKQLTKQYSFHTQRAIQYLRKAGVQK